MLEASLDLVIVSILVHDHMHNFVKPLEDKWGLKKSYEFFSPLLQNERYLLPPRLYTTSGTSATSKQVVRATIEDQLAKDKACAKFGRRARCC